METNPLNKRDSRNARRPSSSVRKIPTNRRYVTGYVSWRGFGSVPFESPLERDFVQRQKFSLSVSSVLAQPCSIPFVTSSGRSETYTPDYLVTYAASDIASGWEPTPLLVEVKGKEDWQLNWREWSYKWKAARRYAAEQGWRFRIMDEARIRTLALENIVFLREYEDLDVSREESDAIVEDLRSLGIAKIDYLLAKHFPGLYRAEGIAHLWHLLAVRRLDCDICDLLGDSTEVWVPHAY